MRHATGADSKNYGEPHQRRFTRATPYHVAPLEMMFNVLGYPIFLIYKYHECPRGRGSPG
jgi:hypothetical protein